MFRPLLRRRPSALLRDVWGVRDLAARRGFVVDHCDACHVARAFRIDDHFAISSIVALPTDASYTRSSRSCCACGKEHVCNEAHYERALGPHEITELSMEEGARRTNRRLARLLGIVDRLRELRDGPAYRTSDRHRDALSEAMGRFEQLVYELVDLEPIAARLERWSELTSDERTELVTELGALQQPSLKTRIEEVSTREVTNVQEPESEPDAQLESARAVARARLARG